MLDTCLVSVFLPVDAVTFALEVSIGNTVGSVAGSPAIDPVFICVQATILATGRGQIARFSVGAARDRHAQLYIAPRPFFDAVIPSHSGGDALPRRRRRARAVAGTRPADPAAVHARFPAVPYAVVAIRAVRVILA